MRARLATQVVEFVRRLPPEPQQRLRRGLRDLADSKGDIKQLESSLDEYCRLRVGAYRIIFSYGKAPTIDCVFAERRSIVYEVLADVLEKLQRGLS